MQRDDRVRKRASKQASKHVTDVHLWDETDTGKYNLNVIRIQNI